MANRNLWALGEELAENPSMWTRVKHSSKGTSARRVGKVSNIPKAMAMGGAMALKQIPVPIVRDVLSAAVDKGYEMAKGYHRRKHQIGKAKDDEGRAKFGWKDMDVKDMDRYRWKVTDSVKSLNTTTAKFNENFSKYAADGRVCDAYVRVTKDYAYACKRSLKLRKKALAIRALCDHTLSWLDKVDRDLEHWAFNDAAGVSLKIKALGEGGHGACEPTVCAVRDEIKQRLNHKTAMNAASGLGALVTGAFDPQEFIVMGQPSSHKLKMDNMYTGEDYS